MKSEITKLTNKVREKQKKVAELRGEIRELVIEAECLAEDCESANDSISEAIACLVECADELSKTQ